VDNPGLLRLGMFVTATFHGQQKETRALVPASAGAAPARPRLGLRAGRRQHVRRVEVTGGKTIATNMQEIATGIAPGRPRGFERAGLAEHGGAVADDPRPGRLRAQTTA